VHPANTGVSPPLLPLKAFHRRDLCASNKREISRGKWVKIIEEKGTAFTL